MLLEDASALIEHTLGIILELRESHYRGGDYFCYSGIVSDNVILESVNEENIEGDFNYTFEGYSCVLHIDNSRMGSIDNLKRFNYVKDKLEVLDNLILVEESIITI